MTRPAHSQRTAGAPAVKHALAAVLVLGLAACGFHPRAHTVLPTKLGPTRIVIPDPYSPLGDEIAMQLQRAGVDAAPATGPATVLKITRESWDTQPLAVDQFALVREYVTRYRVDFVLQGSDGKPMLDPQTIELSREYSFDANAAVGSPAEQELIQRELRRDMEDAILRRIEYALRDKPVPVR
jgi:LPS-assembly lipoprotein